MTVFDLFLAVVVSCQIQFAFPLLKIGTTTQNSDFVEILKEDLRRNNDDYKEMKKNEYSSDKSSTLLDKIRNKTGIQESRRDFRRNDAQIYREYDFDDTIQPFTERKTIKKLSIDNRTQSPLMPEMISKINVVKVNKSPSKLKDPYLKTISKQSFTSTIDLISNNFREIIPKFVNRNKISKFRQFMKKNEGLLRNFVSSKQQSQTQTNNMLESSKFVTHFQPNVLKQGFMGKIRKIHKPRDNNDGALPNPELLDMAPAKGGRIHKKRIKGRLCHRHVLVPEGPKYDSRGRWYLPAHELVARRAYNVTRAPRLLLPRCCNCCKKSLLGCQ